MRRNITDDWNIFKETKLLMYSNRENHGYVLTSDMFYANHMIFAEISETFCCLVLLTF